MNFQIITQSLIRHLWIMGVPGWLEMNCFTLFLALCWKSSDHEHHRCTVKSNQEVERHIYLFHLIFILLVLIYLINFLKCCISVKCSVRNLHLTNMKIYFNCAKPAVWQAGRKWTHADFHTFSKFNLYHFCFQDLVTSSHTDNSYHLMLPA